MQARMNDGSYGEPEPFNKDKMETMLEDENVSHVEVFEGIEKELKRRRSPRFSAEKFEAARRKKRKSKNKLQRKSRRR